GTTGWVKAELGMKFLDDDDWGDTDEQLAYGINAAIIPVSWPVGFYVGYAGSDSDEETDIDGVKYSGETQEFHFGAVKTFEVQSNAMPYVAAGLAMGEGEIEFSYQGLSETGSADGLGLFVAGGVDFMIAPQFSAGISARLSMIDADVDDSDTSVEVGGFSLTGNIGYHF
ncbi:MAG: outer membrane beta-barrel protein, partial [Pseudomonadota bacterium]|nr:outer membrane beta-barrel protein [Pseudomonadota bacterium]